MKLSVFGLGKLGVPMLATFAKNRFKVVGYDINQSIVDSLNKGHTHVVEPGLTELLIKYKANYRASTSAKDAILNSSASFIIVPTPSGEDGLFMNDFVLDCVETIGRQLAEKNEYHLVVITSTVTPGSTNQLIKPLLEKASGKRVGAEIGLCYNPEFIALGTVLRDMTHPDILLIGENDAKAGDKLEEIHKRFIVSKPITHRLNFQEAEIAKIAVNTFVTTKISYGNMLAELCEKIGGADVDNVTNAIGDDSRIGKKYLKGGVAYGGPCFPRDNLAFSALGKSLGVNTSLALSTDEINNYQKIRLSNFVENNCDISKAICIAGCSYKPKTPIFEESAGLALAERLSQLGYKGLITDPVSVPNPVKGFKFIKELDQAVEQSDCIVLMNNDDSYAHLPQMLSKIQTGKKIVIDPWRLFKNIDFDKSNKYITPGKSN